MTTPRARLLAAVLGLAASAATVRAAPAAKVTIAVSGIHTLDPAQIQNVSEHRAVGAMFEGLTVLDPTKPGGVVAGAATKWETAPDGTTWTFHLRPEAKWSDGKPVTAEDFVESWLRLVCCDPPSPNAHLLEVFAGAKALTRDQHLSTALARLAEALDALYDANAKGALRGADVTDFVDGSDFRSATSHMTDPAILKIRDWSSENPLSRADVKKAQLAAEKEGKALLERAEQAQARVGKDQGWFARDEKTLVLQTATPAPHLLRLLAHSALVPLAAKTRNARRDLFDGYNLPTNGAYLSKGPEPDGKGVEKLVLEKSATYWNAAAVPTATFDVWIDREDTLDRWKSGELAWAVHNLAMVAIDKTAFTAATLQTLPKGFAAEYYEAVGATLYLLRFRCDRAPTNDVKVRRALALALDRDALVAAVRSPKPVPVSRLVPPAVAGAPPAPATPAWLQGDKAKRLAAAKGLFGKTEMPGGAATVLVLADDALDPAVAAIDKAWKDAFGFDFDRWLLKRDNYREYVDKANYHALVSFLRPAYDDPMAYLEVFADGHPLSATGWKNATYDALIVGASDPATFAKAPPDAVLKGVADPAAIQAALAKATAGDTAPLRQALLQAAEAMLIDEAVVVPLWLAPEVGLVRPGLKGVERKTRSVLDVGALPAISFEPAK